jgi:hypothetical protein
MISERISAVSRWIRARVDSNVQTMYRLKATPSCIRANLYGPHLSVKTLREASILGPGPALQAGCLEFESPRLHFLGSGLDPRAFCPEDGRSEQRRAGNFLSLVQNTPFFAIEAVRTMADRLRRTDALLLTEAYPRQQTLRNTGRRSSTAGPARRDHKSSSVGLGGLAQLVEHLHGMQGVRSSSLLSSKFDRRA